MYRDLRHRLEVLAEEDNDREAEIGRACPTRLTLYLMSGHIIENCHLVDGLNSVDDRTIDVAFFDVENPEGVGNNWTVQIAHIAMMGVRYPLTAEIELARSAGGRL